MLARLGEHLRGGGPGADEIAHRFMGSVGNLNLGLAGAVQPIHLARLPCMRRCAGFPGQSSYLACRETGRLSAMAIKSAGVLHFVSELKIPSFGGIASPSEQAYLGWVRVKVERPCVGFSHEQVG